MDQESIVVGVDIGGSHITAALVNLETKSIVPGSWVRKRVNSHGTAGEIITTWSTAVDEAFRLHPALAKKIGIAMPGPFDYPNGISLIRNQDKYDALYELNVKELLATHLQISPDAIRLMNDAGCFLRGEVFGGAAQGFRSAIGLTLGTGLGSARYHHGVAEDAALWCAPFRDGITEDYLSTRWFIQRYQELTGRQAKDVKEIAGLVATDTHAQEVFCEFAETLAQFLTSFIHSDSPEVVVIGGNIANAHELFFPKVAECLAAQSIHIPLRKAQLGEEAALIGAASCWEGR